MVMEFKTAERKQAKLRLALCSPSGGGKTYSALKIAKGLRGKIAMIDTEHGSGSLYAGTEGMPAYAVLELDPPYTPKRYVEAIKLAENAGFDILIIDSLTHAWAGEGGVLEMHDRATQASRSGNSFTAWREVSPEHNRLVDAILQSKCHIIGTMRSKQEYAQSTDDSGKTVVKKLGMAPVQREGMDYEFTVVLDLTVEHIASSSKDRTSLFDGQHFKPTEETGEQLRAWLNKGEKPKPIPETPQATSSPVKTEGKVEVPPEVADLGKQVAEKVDLVRATSAQRAKLFETARKMGYTQENVKMLIEKRYQKKSTADLTKDEVEEVTGKIEQGATINADTGEWQN